MVDPLPNCAAAIVPANIDIVISEVISLVIYGYSYVVKENPITSCVVVLQSEPCRVLCNPNIGQYITSGIGVLWIGIGKIPSGLRYFIGLTS